jgi:enoyl-CoA hydratase/carnithine racemase
VNEGGVDSAPNFDLDLLRRGRIAATFADGVLTVTLNAPEIRNAQVPTTWSALAHIGSRISDAVRVVVLTGAGPSFSAGLDRSAFSGGADSPFTLLVRAPGTVADEQIAGFQSGFTWLSDPSFVSIAGVRGHAVGAGFQLALACDIIVAAEDAQFSMAEVTLGLVPDLTGTRRLVRAVGAARALEISATGRRVGAEEAVRIGLALTAVPGDELDDTVSKLAGAFLAGDPDTVRAVTRLITGAADRDVETQLALERSEQIARVRALFARQTG